MLPRYGCSNLACFELAVGREAEKLHGEHRDELHLVSGNGKLVFDLVDVDDVILGVFAQGDHLAMRQELLVSQARLEALSHTFGAREEQDDEVIGARLPSLGGAEPEVPIPALRESSAPEPAQRVARGPAIGVHEDVDIGADLVTERLDVQPKGAERIHHSTRPGARHASA
jgi:hypothetical protein